LRWAIFFRFSDSWSLFIRLFIVLFHSFHLYLFGSNSVVKYQWCVTISLRVKYKSISRFKSVSFSRLTVKHILCTIIRWQIVQCANLLYIKYGKLLWVTAISVYISMTYFSWYYIIIIISVSYSSVYSNISKRIQTDIEVCNEMANCRRKCVITCIIVDNLIRWKLNTFHIPALIVY
jgi:hypothetical protein